MHVASERLEKDVVMAKGTETTLCLDSFNRDLKVYPEPNNFILDLKGRYEVQFAAIGSMELPLSQYTIEADWNTFGFDVGSSLPTEVSCRTLTIQRGSGEVQSAVLLPAPWLPVVSLGGGLWSSSPVPHGLSDDALAIENFGATLLLATDPPNPVPVASLPDSETLSVPGAPSPPGQTGVLLVQNAGVRSFRSPQQLAAVLSAAFVSVQWPLSVEWEATTARAVLSSHEAGLIASVTAGSSYLLRSLGFMCRDGPVPVGPIVCVPRPPPACASPEASTLMSNNFPVGSMVRAQIDPGHYDPSNFRSTVEALVNPLSVVGVVPTSSFTVEEWGLPAVTVLVSSARSYHPLGIARHVTDALALAGTPLVLNFEDNSRFVFRTTGSLPFVVTWGLSAADQDLTQRLGFDPLPTALGEVAAGASRAYEDVPTSVLLPVVRDGVSINLERRFVLVPRARVQKANAAPALVVTSDGVSTLTAPAGDIPLEYVALIGGTGVFAAAERIVGGLVVLRALSPAGTPFLPAGAYASSIVPAEGGAVSLFFLLPPRACFSRLAEIFGFPGGESTGFAPSGLAAPNAWNFEPTPPYVLVELGIQHMSALLSHRCREDIKSNLMAKIPLFPPFKVERGYPMSRSGTGVTVITQMHILLLNPWHQPVRFHGREWSFTLILGSAQRHAHTDCP